jgi:hypothetical protein
VTELSSNVSFNSRRSLEKSFFYRHRSANTGNWDGFDHYDEYQSCRIVVNGGIFLRKKDSQLFTQINDTLWERRSQYLVRSTRRSRQSAAFYDALLQMNLLDSMFHSSIGIQNGHVD